MHTEDPKKIRQMRPLIYLAGPEVFLPDPMTIGEKKKQMCLHYGLEGVFPFDAEVAPVNRSRRETAFLISEANEKLIRKCAGVIANMTPFRGISADVGTAYEMGFARGLGLVVYAYSNIPIPFAERTRIALGPEVRRDPDVCLRDGCGMAIEEWDLMDNLMLEGGVRASGGQFVAEDAPAGEVFTHLGAFETCVRLLSEYFNRRSDAC
jgi:nucleoside 2-deoxyribosyltransferase